MTEQICIRCNVAKPLDAYPRLFSGKAKTCRECRAQANAARRAKLANVPASGLPPMPKRRRCKGCRGPMPSPRMTWCGTCGPDAAPRVFGILSLTGAVWPVTREEFYRTEAGGV